MLELNFELVNIQLNDFTIDVLIGESASRFTVVNKDMKSAQGHVNFLFSPSEGQKGSYLISFIVTEIYDKVLSPAIRSKTYSFTLEVIEKASII